MSAYAARLDRFGATAATAVALLGGTAAIVAAGLGWYGWRHGVAPVDGLAGDSTVGLLFPLAGALLIAQRPRNAAGWVLVSAALIGISALTHQWVHLAVQTERPLPFVAVATWLAAWTFTPYFLQLTLLPLLFPDGSPPSARWRRYAIGVLVLVGVATVAAAFRPDGNVEDLGVANPLGLGPPSTMVVFAGVMIAVSASTMIVGSSVSVAAFVHRIRRSRGREREQLAWLLMGFLAAVLATQLSSLLLEGVWADVVWSLGFAAVPAAIAVAVVRHGLLDVDVVVNRTVVFGLLTVLGVGAYVAVVALAGSVLGIRQAGPVIAAIIAFAAALARERVQRFVDLRLFGARRDPYTVVDRVGAAITGATSPQEAVEELTESLRGALALPFVAIEPTVDGVAASSRGRPVAEVEVVPLVSGGRRVGVMRIGHRHRGERFLAEERGALADVARRAAAVIDAAALTAELAHSRQRLVSAREEERRRIRRDLHDGLGPALAGMALQLDSLAGRLDDDRLVARAERLRTRLAETVSDVRRIVHDLRPAAVDELGLAEALRQLPVGHGELPEVTVDVPESFPDLPAAVEAAAYRVAAEAYTNVVRHAAADRCSLRAELLDDRLIVEVTDDGCGFGTERTVGVGLRSFHDRAREVGGSADVRSQPGRGTVVRVVLPVGAR